MWRWGALGGRLAGHGDGVKGIGFARKSGNGPPAVAYKMVARRDDPCQRRADRGAGDLRQDRIEGPAPAVARHENGDVLLIRGADAGPNRLAYGPCAEGRIDRPLNNSRTKVSSASTIPLSVLGLVHRGRAEKPMPPAKGCARVDAAKFGGLHQAFAFDHRLGMVEPTVLLSQPRHRRLGERVGRASAALAAKPRQTVRRSPGNNFAPAVRAALGFHALKALPSERVRAKASLRRLDCEALGGERNSVSFPKTPSSPSRPSPKPPKPPAVARCSAG